MENPIFIPGQVPSKSNQYQIGIIGGKSKKARASLFKSKNLKEWEKMFDKEIVKYDNPVIEGQFQIQIHVVFQSMKSDIDNCAKIILDCLQKHYWIRNDSDCMKIIITKAINRDNPGFYFKLKRI